MIEFLKWDSGFFNINIGKIELTTSLHESIIDQIEAFDLVYIYQPENFELKIPGFRMTFSEKRILYSKKIWFKENEIRSDLFLNNFPCNKTELNQLYNLAFQSGSYSRFKLDPRIPDTKFKTLYKKWIDKSSSDETSDKIILFRRDGMIRGFLSFYITESYAKISLIAVDKNYRGAGIGSSLLNRLEEILVSSKIPELYVETQIANIEARKFYKKLGFKKKRIEFLKHYWKV